MKMALSVPLADIMAYRKVGKAFFGLLDVLCSNHTLVVAGCDTPTFAFLVSALDSGLKSLDVVISSQCATAVDNLAGFYFKAVQANGSETPPPAAQVPPTASHALHCRHTQMQSLTADCPTISHALHCRQPEMQGLTADCCADSVSWTHWNALP